MEKVNATVLYMEDEEFVADIGRKMLEISGLSVEVCKKGEEALKLFLDRQNSNNPYHFAILDILINTGMGGVETLREIHKIDPTFKAIATSGFADSDSHGDYSKYGFAAFMPKPFLLKDVKQAVAAVLGPAQNA